jgi:hypothetical protein
MEFAVYNLIMRRQLFIVPLLSMLVLGCQSTNSTPANSSSATQAAYTPADGRNLSPELQKDFGQDPQWPNDVARGGGGGRH